MPIEICTLGGFSEVGKNSTAIKVDDEVLILDMGLQMENYISYTNDEREHFSKVTYEELVHENAVPNYDLIADWQDKVIGIATTHAHLDHIGAMPYTASLFPKAPIAGTPYTMAVLKAILRDERIRLPNKLVPVPKNGRYTFSKKITVEFLHMTHSIPHSSLIIVHTPYGKIAYANDYKIDLHPTLGPKPNMKRLKELGEEGEVKLALIESLYAHEHMKTPSESVAKQMLKDVLLSVHAEDNLITITTFASHLARLKSIIALGKQLNRKILIVGRSLSKYISAGEEVGLVDFCSQCQMVRYTAKAGKYLSKINKNNRGKYMLIVTGHQGEPKAVLSRLARGEFPFTFLPQDIVIFSSQVIPVDLNRENRDRLERELRHHNVRIFRKVHVSGHAAREDDRCLITLLKPQKVIPSHVPCEQGKYLAQLCRELGYDKKDVHLMEDGKRLLLK